MGNLASVQPYLHSPDGRTKCIMLGQVVRAIKMCYLYKPDSISTLPGGRLLFENPTLSFTHTVN